MGNAGLMGSGSPGGLDPEASSLLWSAIFLKNIKDTKGTFHVKMGSIKDRSGMDLTEAEDIKKRWQEYKNYTKKIFMTQIITMV